MAKILQTSHQAAVLGVSNFDVDQLRQIQQTAPVETLQPQYSLIERDLEREILRGRQGVAVCADRHRGHRDTSRVNMGQSSNDTFPIAMHIATPLEVRQHTNAPPGFDEARPSRRRW